MFDSKVYDLVTHDPNAQDRLREKEAAEGKREKLKKCLILLESLDT
jgi:hypothetical protein